jgi:hypothetical protein
MAKTVTVVHTHNAAHALGEEREYCLACESWEWADTHACFARSSDAGASALAADGYNE